eukprot:403374320
MLQGNRNKSIIGTDHQTGNPPKSPLISRFQQQSQLKYQQQQAFQQQQQQKSFLNSFLIGDKNVSNRGRNFGAPSYQNQSLARPQTFDTSRINQTLGRGTLDFTANPAQMRNSRGQNILGINHGKENQIFHGLSSETKRTLSEFMYHIRVVSFYRFINAILLFLIGFQLLLSYLSFMHDINAFDFAPNSFSLSNYCLIFVYMFLNISSFTEVYQAKSYITLIRDIWEQPLILKLLIGKCVLYYLVLQQNCQISQNLKSQSIEFDETFEQSSQSQQFVEKIRISEYSYILIAFIDTILSYKNRFQQAQHTNNEILSKIFLYLFFKELRQFTYIGHILINIAVIIILNQSLINQLDLVIWLTFKYLAVQIMIQSFSSYLRYKIIESQFIPIPDNLVQTLNQDCLLGNHRRITMILIRNLNLNILSKQYSFQFRNFISCYDDLKSLIDKFDQELLNQINFLKKVRDNIRKRKYLIDKKFNKNEQKGIQSKHQKQIKIKKPVWYKNFGFKFINNRIFLIKAYVKSVLEYDDILYAYQLTNEISFSTLRLKHCFNSTPPNQITFTLDQLDPHQALDKLLPKLIYLQKAAKETLNLAAQSISTDKHLHYQSIQDITRLQHQFQSNVQQLAQISNFTSKGVHLVYNCEGQGVIEVSSNEWIQNHVGVKEIIKAFVNGVI